MEIWRVGYEESRLPAVVSRRTLTVALLLHLAVFVVFWLYAACHDLFHKDEEIIPIDLTVVVNENLDGKPDEPPPLRKPEPPKPKPKPKEPEKPKELEKIVTNVVKKVDRKIEKKEPEKSKKTKAQLLEEKKADMRRRAVQVDKKVVIEVKNRPSGDGRTDKQPKDWEKYFNQGYTPGAINQLAASDEQLAQKLIRDYIYAKWDRPPWTDTLRPILIQVWFGNGGKILRYELKSGSGDAKADRTALSAISRATVIPRLPPAFIDKYRSTGYPLRFTVTAQ